MKKGFLLVLGYTLTVLGLILFVSPIPFGALVLVAGISILVAQSKTTRRYIRYLRGRNAWLNSSISNSEAWLPHSFRRSIRKTAPKRP